MKFKRFFFLIPDHLFQLQSELKKTVVIPASRITVPSKEARQIFEKDALLLCSNKQNWRKTKVQSVEKK